jgi:hypothetical protein
MTYHVPLLMNSLVMILLNTLVKTYTMLNLIVKKKKQLSRSNNCANLKLKNKLSHTRLLQKPQIFTLPNPSHPRPRSPAMLRLAGLAAKQGGQGRGTHPYTPLKRGFTPSPCGRGLFINPLPWWERAGVRGVL